MKLRTGDFITAALVIALGVAIWLFPFFSSPGDIAVISVDGKKTAELSLSEEYSAEFSGCKVNVSEGAICVESSDCPDGVCVKTGKISRRGESIICVPNRVDIKISGEAEYDAITG